MPALPHLGHAPAEALTSINSSVTSFPWNGLPPPATVPDTAAEYSAVDRNVLFRTGFTVISLTCIVILALMLGSRAKHLGINNFKSMSFMRFLVISLYLTAMMFVGTAAIFESVGTNQAAVCIVGSYFCLAFYILNKGVMYMFLVERAHSIRAPYTSRLKDKVWCFWQLMTGIGFLVIVLTAFMYPHTRLVVDRCQMGLPMAVSVSLLLFDTFINFTLTAVFIWLVRPLLAFRGTSNPDSKSYFRHKIKNSFSALRARIPVTLASTGGPYHQELTRSVATRVERLVWKTLVGTILIVLPTIANMVSLTVMGGREHAWICYAVCTADITFSVCVIHWLTVDPLEVDSRPTATPVPPSRLSRPNVGSPDQPLRSSSTTPEKSLRSSSTTPEMSVPVKN